MAIKHSLMKIQVKFCIYCGREIQWRKKWQKTWGQIRYCSKACRYNGISEVDKKLEDTIIEILNIRGSHSSICPSEVARALSGNHDKKSWQHLLEPARRAARRLAHQGNICILQGGKPVDPANFRGPIRLAKFRSYFYHYK